MASFVILAALFTLFSAANTALAKAEELQHRVDKLETEAGNNSVSIAKIEDSQTEIDTQLRASIDDSNKGLAWQLRVDAMLWEQAFAHKSTLPIDNAVYPNIANGKSQ